MHSRLSKAQLLECREIIRKGSRSFYFASLMLPYQMRMASTALYAFCRVSDDIADSPKASMEAIDRLRLRLDAAYQGTPFEHPADKAFSEIVHLYEIPREVPLAMLEGFEWDVTGKHYETLSDVIDYSVRVAATVGVMMSLIMGRRSSQTLARACDLGIAMQLINIARDVGEDARNGRVYLPEEWLKEVGLSSSQLIEKPQFTKELGSVVERLLNTAELIYQRGMTGISELPSTCRMGVRSAGMVYAEIGEKVRENAYNSIDSRAFTTQGKKLSLMIRALGNFLEVSASDASPAMEETQYLVDIAARETDKPFGDGEWLIDLFGEMERKDRDYLAQARKEAASLSVN